MAEESLAGLAVLSAHDFPQLVHSSTEAEAALDRIRQARLAEAELSISQPDTELPYYTLASETIVECLATKEADRG